MSTLKNKGLLPANKNLEFELGIIKAYLNINRSSSNLLLDINLINTKEELLYSAITRLSRWIL